MTERKPPGMSFETWVDRRIREAEEAGEFDDLPGKGKPIPGAARPRDEMWWINDKLRREGIAHLPPSLKVRKEAEDALVAVREARSERKVREIIETLNDHIRDAIRRPQAGPPLNIMPYDVDRVVAEWRATREG